MSFLLTSFNTNKLLHYVWITLKSGKEGEGIGGKGSEGRERKGREVIFVCFKGKGRKGKRKDMRICPSNFSNFIKIDTIIKIIHSIPLISFS